MSVFLSLLVLTTFPAAWSQFATTPTFLWSNFKTFGDSAQIVDLFPAEKIAEQWSQLKTQPEIILLFVEPDLLTHQISFHRQAFAALQDQIQDSVSSLSIQYTKGSIQDAIDTIVENLPEESTVILASDNSKSQHLSLRDVKSSLPSYQTLKSNGITDVLIVYFDQNEKTDQQFQSDIALLKEIVNFFQDSKFVAIFGSEIENSQTESIQTYPHAHEAYENFESKFEQILQTSTGEVWPNDINAALIIMIPFLIILFIGICCTLDIQSDLLFEADKLK
jgi:hypothetical protein